ncbi:hypothetical protein TIFTF001_051806 [Ficus carica]|uniref:Uncharacterized protein n=1 Tax=Ficus carica TaxID=3494 RepID=A0AA88JET2_FICCA|nr:hypothetical protein TIFTF001_051806 [Ficus carica]
MATDRRSPTPRILLDLVRSPTSRSERCREREGGDRDMEREREEKSTAGHYQELEGEALPRPSVEAPSFPAAAPSEGNLEQFWPRAGTAALQVPATVPVSACFGAATPSGLVTARRELALQRQKSPPQRRSLT